MSLRMFAAAAGLAVLLLAAAPAAAQDRTYYIAAMDDEGADAIDASSIEKRGDYVRAWVTTVLFEKEAYNGGYIVFRSRVVEVDCAARKHRILHFRPQSEDGTAVDDWDAEKQEWRNGASGTIGGDVDDVICAGRPASADLTFTGSLVGLRQLVLQRR